MKRLPFFTFCLTAAYSLLLSSCGDSAKGHATPQAARELAEIREVDLPTLEQKEIVEPELLTILNQTLDHFERTMDTSYTAPFSSFSILHLACMFKKPELVRCLLIDGADPNKHSPDDDSPLLLAVGMMLTPNVQTETLISLADTLLDAGADFSKSGHTETDFLTQASFVCENEEVILHLLDKGAQPDEDSGIPPALHGWVKLLTRLIEDKHVGVKNLMRAVAVGSCRFKGNFQECLDLLIRHGANVHDTFDDEPGATPLFFLAEELSNSTEGSPFLSQGIDMCAYLLQLGADPYLRAENDERHPGFCPYDFLSMRPKLLAELEERGISLQPPPLHFSSGAALLSELCRAVISHRSQEELAPHYEKISTVLTPSPELRSHDIYTQALEAAVTLLAQIDPARAAADITAMPVWKQAESDNEARELTAHLLSVLRDEPSIILPKSFITTEAEALIRIGMSDEAASLIELLERCPDAKEEILRYCEDTRPAIQAGAYAARLQAEALPDARNNGVASWLLQRHRQANTPFLEEAILITSLDKLWFGDMPAAEQQKMLSLMRRIGAPAAADAYEHILRHLDDPDELDALSEQGDDWKYELETATARFFLEHKDDFITSPAP